MGRRDAAAGFALCAHFLLGHALRREDQSPWPVGFEEEATTTPAPELYGDLPPLQDFKRDFIRRRNVELFDDVSSRIRTYSDFRMVMGVWTRPYMKMYREVVRQTWMSQEQVCPLKDGPQDGCSIFTTFVMGTSGDGVTPLSGMPLLYFDDARSEADMMLLKTPETRKHAKALEFFYKSALENPWATHIAKLDMQTYPLVPKLLNRMWEEKFCHHKYQMLGEPMKCNRTAENDCDMPDFQSKQCRIADCKQQERPFDYLAGPFISLSRSLALESMHPSSSLYAKRVSLGVVEPEDRAIARNIMDWGFESNNCIQVWDPIAMHHPLLRHDASF